MSHFLCVVLVPQNEMNPLVHAEELLAPFHENTVGWESGKWDWWQLGGRWTGCFDGYDPTNDTRNSVTCALCNGTGDRPGWVFYEKGERTFTDDWAENCNGCNGCNGNGKRIAWPTNWVEHAGDISPVRSLPADLKMFALVTPDGTWRDRDDWGDDTSFDAEVTRLLSEHSDDIALAIDCHS